MTNTKEYPVVMTLDAGETNFAIKSGQVIVNPVQLPSHGNDLDLCLKNIIYPR